MPFCANWARSMRSGGGRARAGDGRRARSASPGQAKPHSSRATTDGRKMMVSSSRLSVLRILSSERSDSGDSPEVTWDQRQRRRRRRDQLAADNDKDLSLRWRSYSSSRAADERRAVTGVEVRVRVDESRRSRLQTEDDEAAAFQPCYRRFGRRRPSSAPKVVAARARNNSNPAPTYNLRSPRASSTLAEILSCDSSAATGRCARYRS